MSEITTIALDDLVDGVVPGQAQSDDPKQVSFIGPANSSINFNGGMSLTFVGGVFRHTNPELIEMLRKLSRRGAGIFELTASQDRPVAVEKQIAAELKAEALAVKVN